jgi:hypothetical protein
MQHQWEQLDGPWLKERVTVWRCQVCGLRRIVLRRLHEDGEPPWPPLDGCPGPRE